MTFIPPTDAETPLVLALDLGTSSLRALLFDRRGRGITKSEEQLRYRLRTTADGGAETDARSLFDLLIQTVDGALNRARSHGLEIAAVGTTCFWHSLLGLDAQHEPVTPLYYWADTRAAGAANALRRDLDEGEVQARTGCRLHSSYWPAKLRWIGEAEPQRVARVARWVSFAEYAALRLHGEQGGGVTHSMASGTGLLDVRQLIWDYDILAASGIAPDCLSPLGPVSPGTALNDTFARRWPALADIPWFPALGDGACANVGSGAVGPDRIALTLGTSGAMRLVMPAPPGELGAVPSDLWAYRLDADQAVLGGALSNGGNVLRSMRELLSVPATGPVAERAATLLPDSHGLTLLPFVAGERSPKWHDHAASTIAGITLSTRPEHVVRAAMEAVAYRFARLYDALRPLASPTHQIVANGGAILNSPVWRQIITDALGHDLLALPPDDEASARGAALVALVEAGLLTDFAAAVDPAAGAQIEQPHPDHHRRYLAGRSRQERLETALSGLSEPSILS